MIPKLAKVGLVLMVLILIFSLIHIGVSIGCIINNRDFGTLFRPEIGLASYNLVLSFIGIVVVVFGTISLLANQKIFGCLIAVLSGVLGIFALASLITAIIINAKSASYINSCFTTYMVQYGTSTEANRIIDLIQTKYRCCGGAFWLDWAISSGVAPIISISKRRSVRMPTEPFSDNIANLLDGNVRRLESQVDYHYPRESLDQSRVHPVASSRAKRQYIFKDRQPLNLSYSDQFWIPTTCCSSIVYAADGKRQANCTSPKQLYAQGCLTYVINQANEQDMGFGVINSFMVVLALIAIPLLWLDYSYRRTNNEQHEAIKNYGPHSHNPANVSQLPTNLYL